MTSESLSQSYSDTEEKTRIRRKFSLNKLRNPREFENPFLEQPSQTIQDMTVRLKELQQAYKLRMKKNEKQGRILEKQENKRQELSQQNTQLQQRLAFLEQQYEKMTKVSKKNILIKSTPIFSNQDFQPQKTTSSPLRNPQLNTPKFRQTFDFQPQLVQKIKDQVDEFRGMFTQQQKIMKELQQSMVINQEKNEELANALNYNPHRRIMSNFSVDPLSAPNSIISSDQTEIVNQYDQQPSENLIMEIKKRRSCSKASPKKVQTRHSRPKSFSEEGFLGSIIVTFNF